MDSKSNCKKINDIEQNWIDLKYIIGMGIGFAIVIGIYVYVVLK